jgi:aspartyl-tRNA(Asn)/glutamyl-tRNA(Gln) amidotransferase subunit B
MPGSSTHTACEAVIGLEVHVQLATESKLFCSCANKYGEPSNTLTCPVCLGLPGALPVLNEAAVAYAVSMILAVGGDVQNRSEFARKNYFYPDLPKGYQISQYDYPLGSGGAVHYWLPDGSERSCALERIHLEEDAGKSLHPERGEGFTQVDLNRCGAPLIEVVSAPDLRSPEEAYACLQAMRQLVRYLGISDADMEKGQLRCDANVSVRRAGGDSFGTRTEVKNLNSVKAVRRALEYEVRRQSELLDSGGEVEQVTLMWNEATQTAEVMRTKEESEDYRYFPEPDLPALRIGATWVDRITESLPELPAARMGRLAEQYGLRSYDARILCAERELADYFEAVAGQSSEPTLAANWIINEVLAVLREHAISPADWQIQPSHLAELLREIESGRITGKIAKRVFGIMTERALPGEEVAGKELSAARIIDDENLAVISDEATLTGIVDEVLTKHPDQVTAYKAGKQALMGFFVGKVMEATNGRAEPGLTSRMLKQRLDND